MVKTVDRPNLIRIMDFIMSPAVHDKIANLIDNSNTDIDKYLQSILEKYNLKFKGGKITLSLEEVLNQDKVREKVWECAGNTDKIGKIYIKTIEDILREEKLSQEKIDRLKESSWAIDRFINTMGYIASSTHYAIGSTNETVRNLRVEYAKENFKDMPELYRSLTDEERKALKMD